MTGWTADQIARLARSGELRIAGRRADGTLRDAVIIWSVTLGNNLYVRSVRGSTALWYRGTQIQGVGHIASDGVDTDVTFTRDETVDDQLDAVYRSKYGNGPAVDHITATTARATTLKVTPA